MNYKRYIFLPIIICLFSSGVLLSQENPYFNGYKATREGEIINYEGADPRAATALLVRSQDSTRIISWETEKLPETFRQSSASYVWLFGMDATADCHSYRLIINGHEVVSFINPVSSLKGDKQIDGLDGTTIRFRTTMNDQHGDAMGYAILNVPARFLVKGKSQVINIHGESADSPVWYMTFEFPVNSEINVVPESLLIQTEGMNKQSVRIEAVYLGDDTSATIQIGKYDIQNYGLRTGYNAFRYYIPEIKQETSFVLKYHEKNDQIQTIKFKVSPVRPWYIYLVQHTHTDIGYTRPQSDILPEHLRFIDYALDYCDQTDDYSDDARFRWTCESAWAVKEYLKRRPPEQIDRLLKRIAEGRIEVTAMPFNLSEIADEGALSAMLQPLRQFHNHGIPVKTAMQDDVNGIGWCLADYLPDAGVKYLVMGEHGHRALIPFDKPTPFWWISPSGKRMLAYRGEHYMYGNFLLLHTGDLENFRIKLLKYLEELESKGYPFDRISLQYSGYFTDNSPPATISSKLIREWNEKYIWPKLRSATVSEYLTYIENNHGDEIPSFRKAWPDWWTDGFGSAALETAVVRETQSEMLATENLLTMAELAGSEIPGNIPLASESIYENILFYDEHTFGAAESISQPQAENSVIQWREKSSYAWEAYKQSRLMREEALGILQQYLPKYNLPSIAVFNSLNWQRSGPVKLYIDHQILSPDEKFMIVDEENTEIPVQALSSRADGTYWILWARDIPSLGYRSFKVIKGEGSNYAIKNETFTGTFENQYYKIRWDQESGSLVSLYDKDLQFDCVNRDLKWKPGDLIHEQLTDRHQLELYRLDESPVRTGLKDISFESIEKGPVWTSIRFSGNLPECAAGPVLVEYRIYNHEKRIEVNYAMTKKSVTDPEAVYVAFPFDISNGKILFEAQGGIVRPGMDQLQGTASDWNTVQNFVSLRAPKMQLIMSSPQIPLFQFGGLNIGQFRYHYIPESTNLYSWVLNNYWTTNFKASQEGELKWSYSLTTTADTSNIRATQFGWSTRIPFVGRVLPGGETAHNPAMNTFAGGFPKGVILISSRIGTDKNSLILHIRETSGKLQNMELSKIFHGKSIVHVSLVNIIDDKIRDLTDSLTVEPYESCFVKVQWK